MKIDGLDPTKGVPSDPKKAQPAPGSDFGGLLDSMVSKSGSPAQTQKTTAPMPGAGVPFIPPPLMDPGVSDPAVIGLMDSVLTDLDMFKNALANNDIPMERLSGIVSTLVERKDELASMIGRVSDEELKGMLTESLDMVIGLVNDYHAGYTA